MSILFCLPTIRATKNNTPNTNRVILSLIPFPRKMRAGIGRGAADFDDLKTVIFKQIGERLRPKKRTKWLQTVKKAPPTRSSQFCKLLKRRYQKSPPSSASPMNTQPLLFTVCTTWSFFGRQTARRLLEEITVLRSSKSAAPRPIPPASFAETE